MNDQVGGYSGLVDSLARKVAGTTRARRVGAEQDDLAQEGLLNVWQTLERGVTPSAEIIEHRMYDYIRWLSYQTGHSLPECELDEAGEPVGDCPQHVPYDTLLPLDDFRGVRVA